MENVEAPTGPSVGVPVRISMGCGVACIGENGCGNGAVAGVVVLLAVDSGVVGRGRERCTLEGVTGRLRDVTARCAFRSATTSSKLSTSTATCESGASSAHGDATGCSGRSGPLLLAECGRDLCPCLLDTADCGRCILRCVAESLAKSATGAPSAAAALDLLPRRASAVCAD